MYCPQALERRELMDPPYPASEQPQETRPLEDQKGPCALGRRDNEWKFLLEALAYC